MFRKFRKAVGCIIAAAVMTVVSVTASADYIYDLNNTDLLDEIKATDYEIYGTEGILTMGDPNQFGAPVYLQKPLCEPVEFPFTHGYQENSRGLGAAEMAWSILAGRDHRASKEMAYHVFETMHGIMTSAETGSFYQLQSTFQTPAALPAGYRSVGDWSRKEESALI